MHTLQLHDRTFSTVELANWSLWHHVSTFLTILYCVMMTTELALIVHPTPNYSQKFVVSDQIQKACPDSANSQQWTWAAACWLTSIQEHRLLSTVSIMVTTTHHMSSTNKHHSTTATTGHTYHLPSRCTTQPTLSMPRLDAGDTNGIPIQTKSLMSQDQWLKPQTCACYQAPLTRMQTWVLNVPYAGTANTRWHARDYPLST